MKFQDQTLPLTVVVANTRWNEPPRMRHHVTEQLAKSFNVLFVEFFPNTRQKEELIKTGNRLIIFRPNVRKEIKDSIYINIPPIHKWVNLNFNNEIKEKILELGYEKAILFNFSWNYYQLFDIDYFLTKVYVCNDEFPLMFSKSKIFFKRWYQRWLFNKYEKLVTKKADFCYTPHYPLQKKLKQYNKDVRMLFHAHNNLIRNPSSHLVNSSTSRTIKVAYAGFIHYRIDVEWVISLLNENDIELYLIGPLSKDFPIEALRKYSSFNLLPPLSESEMIAKLEAMDVLIIPYRTSLPEVQAITTLSKLFQYISTLRPIVSSNLPNFLPLPQGVLYVANNKNDFVEKVRKAHREDNENFISLRKDIAAQNTWDSRGDQIIIDLNERKY